jgi:hypothetical protein
VSVRTDRARLSDALHPKWVFHVEIQADGASSVGRLAFSDRLGERQERSARDASCAQVVDALALIVAIAIDPHTLLSAPSSLASKGRDVDELPRTPQPAPAPPSAAPPPPRRSRAATIGRPEAAAGLRAIARSGFAPDVAPGAGVFAHIALEGERSWRPAALLSIDYARSSPIAAGSGAAQSELLAARLDACGARFAIGRRLHTGVCPALELGVFHAVGLRLAQPSSSRATWAAAAALIRAEWAPLEAWVFEIEGGPVVPLLRHAIVVGPPRGEVYAMPAVGMLLAAGVGVHFL